MGQLQVRKPAAPTPIIPPLRFVIMFLTTACPSGDGASPQVAPAISVQPQSQSVTAPATATFNVTATGTAPLSYQWNKNGSAISGTPSATYTTPATTSADNGAQYTATVTNIAGSVTSNPATLIVSAESTIVALDYSRELFGTAPTLRPTVQSVDVSTHTVVIQGEDSRAPSIPFTFSLGDGSVTNGFFPQSHLYTDASRNYVVRVTAHYSLNETDSADVVVRFVPPQITATSFPAAVTVTIPAAVPALGSRQAGYTPPSNLQPFDDSFFGPSLPRSTAEYVLSQAANVEADILENDIEQVNGDWRQVVLRDPAASGAYSIWYSTPIAVGAAASFFQGTPGYSSLFHEMGHNLSLNAPASFRYGGRIDGNANAIFSEAVAQMFQHSVAYELVNNASKYGLPSDLTLEMANSARVSAQVVRGLYDTYIGQGKPFATWNDPSTTVDETEGTFMTVARQFMIHAEQAKAYIGPLTRTMRLLRTFNPTLAAKYAPGTNSAAADVFRSTLMVAALSYGFKQDLRAEFRALNFGIDDATFTTLYNSIP